MFVDKVKVEVMAGKGGDGIVSWRRERFIDRGGPDGGDGGKGGDIIFRADLNQDTLSAFRYKKLLKAEPGQNGSKRKRHGKSGANLMVAVPVGTAVFDEAGELIADLTKDGQEAVIAKGGTGGYGNAHFASSRRQAPRISEKGEPGQKLTAILELKLIADVGLVGLPNAGKSTLLAAVSNARPEIADYPFTTLSPNLGVVDIDEQTSVLIADIPGLIEGAAKGKGLGDEFLRHTERAGLLVHLVDAYQPDLSKAYKTIMAELKAYKTDLSHRPQIVALNKIDGLDKIKISVALKTLQKSAPKGVPVLAMSAKSGAGVKELLYEIKTRLEIAKSKMQKAKNPELPVIKLTADENTWTVTKEKGYYAVVGQKIERFARRTDFTNPEGVRRLRDIMSKMGILRALENKGIKPGEEIRVDTHRLIY